MGFSLIRREEKGREEGEKWHQKGKEEGRLMKEEEEEEEEGPFI